MSTLLTNPILAALAEGIAPFANRRISAGFIVEAATGTTARLPTDTSRDPPAHFRVLDNLPVISTLPLSGAPLAARPLQRAVGQAA
jgi:hypothetical protein